MTAPRSCRPRLLVSVRDAVEAASALAGGADIIDVKEPSRGPLGMADVATIEQVMAVVAGRAPVSAALGDIGEGPLECGGHDAALAFRDAKAVPPQAEAGSAPPQSIGSLAYVKIGLAQAPADWPQALARRYAAWSPARAIAVAYADHPRVAAPSVADVLAWAIEHYAAGLLVDTAVKDGRGLFDWLDDAALCEVIRTAHDAGLLIALAGSLHGESFARAAASGPDIVAVRGAACTGRDRGAIIDGRAVAVLVAQVDQLDACNALRHTREIGID
ncbi:MAG: (5-formylfuran-3-yl)methyl phosphate synthase [Phycisphaeraceae bacterium]